MDNRPRGILLICVLFGVMGFGLLFAGIGVLRDVLQGTPDQTGLSVVLVYAIPMVVILCGALAVESAVALFNARPYGRLIGLTLIALWLSSVVSFEILYFAGFEIAREASNVPGAYFFHILAGALIFFYLWTTGSEYVDDGAVEQPSPTPAGEQ